jgi:hypothetical protein
MFGRQVRAELQRWRKALGHAFFHMQTLQQHFKKGIGDYTLGVRDLSEVWVCMHRNIPGFGIRRK